MATPQSKAAQNDKPNNNALTLHESRGESRVDSRVIAAYLGQTHQHVRELIEDHRQHFERFGVLRFETGKPPRGSAGGRPERFALINEDQCYFLLSLSRNTERVVDLKARLVLAFREARERRNLADATYLPGYHALHDEVMALAKLAHDNGSMADDNVFHCNANKLVNTAAGISPGMRDRLTDSQRLMVINLQEVIRNAIRRAIAAGADHKAAYQQAKEAAASFASTAGRLLGGA
ncbi:Rha family transcriptional regulator [Burkholderia sp. Ac-20353]|nr:Rha family transcriptional regulator [Burkholderia sp. Ac-20353]